MNPRRKYKQNLRTAFYCHLQNIGNAKRRDKRRIFQLKIPLLTNFFNSL
jgi:hypothetical protein